jgi:hypothetical protein
MPFSNCRVTLRRLAGIKGCARETQGDARNPRFAHGTTFLTVICHYGIAKVAKGSPRWTIPSKFVARDAAINSAIGPKRSSSDIAGNARNAKC